MRQSRAFQMNTLVLLDPRHTVIVDPGVLPSELDDLAAMVSAPADRTRAPREAGSGHPAKRGRVPGGRHRRPADVTLVFSHAHWDHVLGRSWWPRASTLAHARLAAELSTGEAEIRRAAESCAAAHGERFPQAFRAFAPDRAIDGERAVELGPWRLVFREAPGHSASQMTVHLPDRGLLFAADMLSDIEIPALDGPIEVYRRTLDSLFPLFEGAGVETLVPGHGTTARGRVECGRRLLRDTLYLVELEVRVRAARGRGLSLEETERALAGMTYAEGTQDYPMEPVHRENVRHAYAGLARAGG